MHLIFIAFIIIAKAKLVKNFVGFNFSHDKKNFDNRIFQIYGKYKLQQLSHSKVTNNWFKLSDLKCTL